MDRLGQLLGRILGELLAGVLGKDSLEGRGQLLQRLAVQVGVLGYRAGGLRFGDRVLEQLRPGFRGRRCRSICTNRL